MKKNRVLAMVLSGVLAVAMAACGSSEGTDSSSASDTTSGSIDSGEAVTIKISYPILAAMPSDEGIVEVENAMNEYLASIGENIVVDLDPVDGTNYTTQIDMQLVSGDKIDIYIPVNGLDVAVEDNKVLPLDDYLDNELAGAVEIMGEDFLGNCVFSGQTYGIPCYKGSVLIYYWVCPKEIFDSLGVDRESITNVRDLTEVLEIIHEMYPEMDAIAPSIGANGAGNSFNLTSVLAGEGDYEVTSLNNGLCIVGDDLTVLNMYDTDYFMEACQIAYEWNQNGYISSDASVATDTPSDLVAAGRAASYIIGYAYDVDTVEGMSLVGSNPYETVAIPLSQDMLVPNGLTAAIAYTCENPSAAAKVLNMLYTDEFMINSLIFGVEGSDWVDAGTGDGSILWPDGETMETVPYTAALTCGIIGNQFIMYSMEGITSASDIPFMAENMETAKRSPVFGFAVNVSNVTSEVSAVSNVVTQYIGALSCGELDPEEYIPIFVDALEAAGIDQIIEEGQAQLDEWLAQE